MQSICLDEFGGEKAVEPSSQETTLIQHIFGGQLQSQVMQITRLYSEICFLFTEVWLLHAYNVGARDHIGSLIFCIFILFSKLNSSSWWILSPIESNLLFAYNFYISSLRKTWSWQYFFIISILSNGNRNLEHPLI